MQFLNEVVPQHDLTYSDVFIVPGHSGVRSRFEVDLTPPEGIGTTFPVVVANMNDVSGSRMAETMARRGGLAVLSQDIPLTVLEGKIERVKNAHPVFDTALTLGPDSTINEAMAIIDKRAHDGIVVVDDSEIVGIVTSANFLGNSGFSKLHEVMNYDVEAIEEGLSPEEMFNWFQGSRHHYAPVMGKVGLVGAMTKKSALRRTLYEPALDKDGRLMVAAALGINGDVSGKAESLLEMGVDILVIDTAHGDQTKTEEAISRARAKVGWGVPIVAGNVVTADGTARLIDAGADIVKVGVGPGAMCTTRMMTGVGRPQFSAVLDCANKAKELGRNIWADGGVRHPRDVALALAAGASSAMVGTWFAGTKESAADTEIGPDGRSYKRNSGMASRRAVKGRNGKASAFELARRSIFEEGISESTMFIDPNKPGVEDLLDDIYAGVRSAATYIGARTVREMTELAVIGVQSQAGYSEGQPIHTSW